MAKSEKLYNKSPSLKRNEKGDMAIEKPSEADQEDAGVNGEPGVSEGAGHDMSPEHERREVAHKHVKEKMDMHHRHEMEHAMNEDGDKSALHAKHQAEHADMHKRHENEIKEMHKRHESVKE